MNLASLLDDLVVPVRAAGAAILAVRAKGVVAREKSDASPVTEADEAAEKIIFEALQKIAPQIPFVGEEQHASGFRHDVLPEQFWLVDPLDGTKSFVRGDDDFTVNIALVQARRVIAGIVSTPTDGKIWAGFSADGASGAWVMQSNSARAPLRVRKCAAPVVAVVSKSHLDQRTKEFLQTLGPVETADRGSSLKFCMVAEGQADIYPRFGPTCEWDTAAGHAVLIGAGGSVTTPDGADFLYAKPDFVNGAFIARGG